MRLDVAVDEVVGVSGLAEFRPFSLPFDHCSSTPADVRAQVDSGSLVPERPTDQTWGRSGGCASGEGGTVN
jgi:hypothetical protein